MYYKFYLTLYGLKNKMTSKLIEKEWGLISDISGVHNYLTYNESLKLRTELSNKKEYGLMIVTKEVGERILKLKEENYAQNNS